MVVHSPACDVSGHSIHSVETRRRLPAGVVFFWTYPAASGEYPPVYPKMALQLPQMVMCICAPLEAIRLPFESCRIYCYFHSRSRLLV
ncbi:Piso0_000980 [Millerozyma farinosa CBS 7064]|uniref:Piso0_000980 protein n=1 Tax=Pichia sorbitophila (strain ATCC MYA-4447 / BCRC 22081 / CBS 7064 / NBRC 10061 / NRRL Y-12695) TaxID=559304 RepID=G8YQL0_PICSO|nr:Piso0_000980 [Millerozyma farinosa CBS 7064]CCE78945.1 Piso0_000980 [Millerozyma farinosa CBS 7064]